MGSMAQSGDLEMGYQHTNAATKRCTDIWHSIVALFGGGISLLKVESGAEARIQTQLGEKAAMDCETILEQLDSSNNGLTARKAEELLKTYGPNILPRHKGNQWYQILWNALWHPFNLILVALAIISGATSDIATVSLMCAMIVLSVGLRFQQELKTSREAFRLTLMIQARATVLRQDNTTGKSAEMDVNQSDIVPGDIVVLRMGDLLPADVRMLTSKNLLVSESSLTGESIPVEKVADIVESKSITLAELRNVCFMGTSVVSGEGTGVVLSTGHNTYIGTVASVLGRNTPTNAFQNGVRRVSFLLVCFMLVMVPIVILISGLSTRSWSGSFLFGISVAVGLTPEMLPMIVNTNLARGAYEMARKKCIVKRMDAVQNMGAMDVLCTDKTGTLTIDKVILVQYSDRHGASRHQVFEYAYMNSSFQTGLRNPIDNAILAFGDLIPGKVDLSKWKKIDEIPFDFERRRLSVLLEKMDDMVDDVEACKKLPSVRAHSKLLVTKGALEEMLSICTSIQDSENDETILPMTVNLHDSLLKMGEDLNSDGLRVLVVATKWINVPNHEEKDNSYEASRQMKDKLGEECGLVFQGFLSFSDPPKESAKEAIDALTKAGVTIKVLTGDNLPIAIKVCKDLGIATDHVASGPQLASQDKLVFHETVKKATILAKLTPFQKLEVIQALKSASHTVGYLGDGLNDVLALKEADVGMSVDSAIGVAKDAAEIILLEKDLNVLVAGVRRGRITHGNTIKYIKMAASSNFGNVFSILVAAAWLPFNPMRPVQILTQNLLYDISQVSIPWDKMDAGYTDVPRRWSAKGIAKFMLCMGPISSIFDIATFSLMWWYYGVRTKDQQALLQTAWFVEGLTTQTLVIHALRTAKVPFVQEAASKVVFIVTSLVILVGLILPFTPLGKAEKMVHLPATFYGFVVAIDLSYCLLAQVGKVLYIKYFKTWL